jgi:transcriptional regulator with XRE-family HTH domain
MAKLTQAELAEKIHLTRSSITNIEGGIQVPQPIALTSMARVLKVQEQAFFPKPGSSQEEFQDTLEKLDPAQRDVIERFVGRV